ncbi:glycosyltransferase family 2 protein [Chryseobacterium jejuense]|uniref:Glycosyl transferase family 2 n=1 Tax=Chryseobacterium jejuense TaxID=445960 RepID=A0A2X2WUC4_CHRJE|nr:glycosyltransferase family 2 protein [Chryseobacterium jejuense]SDI28293.1 Glycosyl transferase family 2 [Chryseobacterium jejuense]SQB44586.1 SPBc2 prophage-derived glycosyltransferase SunS [Chryseobacterium jejuense]
MKISLCLIVKNEEKFLSRCLESAVKFADEIIVVDTGSMDKTKEIAEKFTDKIFDFEWINDFSAARNFAFSKATMDYQMWLDADDVIPEKSINEINELKKKLSDDVEIVTMKYGLSFDENNNPTFHSTRERLFKKSKNYQWIEPVHECIPLVGNIYYTDIEIWHKKEVSEVVSTRNIEIYRALEESGKEFSARQLYYYARELKDHHETVKAITFFEKFLASGSGWIEDVIACCQELAIEYKKNGTEEKILPTLLKSFEYDIPRPEICCELGYYYKDKQDYNQALKWFDLATRLPQFHSVGFVSSDYTGYIPNIEACVCLSFLGEYKKANEYNEIAALSRPNCPSVRQNRDYLRELI